MVEVVHPCFVLVFSFRCPQSWRSFPFNLSFSGVASVVVGIIFSWHLRHDIHLRPGYDLTFVALYIPLPF